VDTWWASQERKLKILRKLCQILSPWSGGVPEVSTHPRVKTNVEVQNTNNFLIFHSTCAKYRAFFVVEFVLLVCWKEG
jgi:hypothetical protein